MKERLKGIAIGIILIVSIAGTGINNIVPVRLDTPRATISKSFMNGTYPDTYIMTMAKKGYIVQHLSKASGYTTVVMVKY